ncbi:hypothetical protein PFISCL1PPCAC_18177, partial [Pristionchus fissidentatus]
SSPMGNLGRGRCLLSTWHNRGHCGSCSRRRWRQHHSSVRLHVGRELVEARLLSWLEEGPETEDGECNVRVLRSSLDGVRTLV